MSVQVLEREFPNDHLPLLRWLMFTGVCAFGFVLVWYYGLFRLMLVSDKTYISSIIVLLYAATCIHCFVRTVAISPTRSAADGSGSASSSTTESTASTGRCRASD